MHSTGTAFWHTRALRWVAFLIVGLGLTGCQSSMMVKANREPEPSADKALVVFMRPSSFGGAIQSSVYDTGEAKDTFIGIVSTGTKVAYLAEPGQHRFMVVAENADFLEATLNAGKTYYVLVSPRMGVWKARFSLLPIRNNASAEHNVKSGDFAKWQSKTHWVGVSPEAEAWYREHESAIREKKNDYLKKWKVMAPADKAELTLHAEDGI
ncbi:DUF2846 domain-containing protein [Tahibacter amnicola]|uniref:DUF2846 domain-containing protein n=1 Tax=Tahibacter amnicola TaxID=2976241 RepID=A0ABY6B8N6_9GAMM|nr:DUF2846 domain-containing protein [Tahibacter amnicola]UXI66379.1 DUF2846 domain-containing protein [Tahibacter amnicola]